MGFKYEEDRIFIVVPRDNVDMVVNGKVYGADAEVRVQLKTMELYHAWCYNGKFYVYNNYVQLALTAEQLDLYFKKPFVGIPKD